MYLTFSHHLIIFFKLNFTFLTQVHGFSLWFAFDNVCVMFVRPEEIYTFLGLKNFEGMVYLSNQVLLLVYSHHVHYH